MIETAVESPVEARPAGPAGCVDLHSGVHKGLRAAMAETLAAAGRLDAHDPAEVAATAAQVRTLLDLCRTHLHHETQFVLSAMQARRPGSACATAQAHEDQLRVIERLEADLLAVERAATGAKADAALHLYGRLALFVAGNLEHMHVEEIGNNAVLWATHSDEELAEIQQAIVAALRPDTLAAFLRWMVPAMSPAERAELLGGIQLGAPREVFERILAIARPHLGERDWTKLMAALAPLPAFA